MGDFFNTILSPLYYLVSGIMLGWHWVFEHLGLPADSGWTWMLSIVGLTVTIRAMLIPLFVKQIKSSRNMQLLQPQVKELQKKYGHDRERLAQEQMKLFKDTGTNPLSSCMPLLLQMPIFFALFRVIDHAANGEARGFLKEEQAESIKDAVFLGVHIADRFVDGDTTVKLITGTMVVIMCATTFTTQRQLMSKNMPPSAMTGQYAQTQKMMLYVLPFVFAIGGIAFPIGVLMYWVTSNLWTMGQQFWVIRNNPVPGTEAARAKERRDAAKGKTVAPPEGATSTETKTETKAPPQRQQPRNQSRKNRKKPGGGK
ncbi:membrane protein insertase YidC [Solicola gregarius]|uniref:Membrane protein insertase YidC n=1 Tax=Solicola gregarius TaxID=2908642 RepID=A0AA46YM55_9ACTN|nr:membrane protein insertase YidC [Solicola gregarius]UYM07362.1 membrane protein insertase YidC [Solicola gregarius]